MNAAESVHLHSLACWKILVRRLLLVVVALTLSLPCLALAQSAASLLEVTEEDYSGTIVLAPEALTAIESEFVASHPSLRVAVAGISFPPFQTLQDNRIGGPALQYLRAIAHANGFKLEYQIYDSWQEVLDALKNREADLTPLAGITDDRLEYMVFTNGVTPNPAGLVGKREDTRFVRNQQLTWMRVSVGKGFVAQSYLGSQFPDAVPVMVQSPKEALQLIQRGEVDYYYGNLSDVFFEPDRTLVEPLEIKQRVYYSTGWNHIGVRSDWPLIKQLFNRFISRGRGLMNPMLEETMGEQLSSTVPPLTATPQEVAYLSQFKSLRIGTITGVPLLNDTDDRGHHVGIASEFTAFIAYQLGLPIELTSFDTNEKMLEALYAGEIDLIPYFAITDERKKSMLFTDPYLEMPWLTLGRVDNTLYWDLGSLTDKTLALRKQHPLLPMVIQKYPDIEIVLTNSAVESVDAVASGNADATIETKLYVNRVLSQHHAGKLQVLGEVKEAPGEFAFVVDSRNQLMVPIINRAFATMDSDFADRVIRRWVAVDFEPERRLRTYLNVLVPFLGVLALFLLATLYWNRKIVKENIRRLAAEQRLVDMTEHLRTGVYQFRQYADSPIKMEFSNRVTREMARVHDDDDDNSRIDFFDHIDPADRPRVLERLRHCLSTGEHFRESFRFNYPDGQKGWILSDAFCRQESDGARVWSGYLFDLTSERLLSEELNSMLVDRDEFFSMASHELRTPVQNISLALESIDHSDMGEAQSNRLSIATSAASDLKELIDDLLQLASMNTHSAVLSQDPVDLHALIATVFKSFSMAAKKKKLAYDYHIDADVPSVVIGDALRIKQVLYNVIGNAIKYTDEGSIQLSVSVQKSADRSTANPRSIKFVVTDTGVGIPDQSMSRLFEPFSTIGSSSSRKSTGLGLALVDKLLAVMGGQISVTSTEGVGSAFTIILPVKNPEQATSDDVSDTASAKNRWHADSHVVVVADDNFLVRETLSALLQESGWTVLQAASGDAALTFAQSVDCVAVVTDQQMPGMTGLELAQTIRQSTPAAHARPVLILMSGGMDRVDAAQASTVFDAMLFKPIKAGTVSSTIRDIVFNERQGTSRPSRDPSLASIN